MFCFIRLTKSYIGLSNRKGGINLTKFKKIFCYICLFFIETHIDFYLPDLKSQVLLHLPLAHFPSSPLPLVSQYTRIEDDIALLGPDGSKQLGLINEILHRIALVILLIRSKLPGFSQHSCSPPNFLQIQNLKYFLHNNRKNN